MLDAFKVMKELNQARFLLKKNHLCTDDIDIKINQQEKVLLHLSIDYIELKTTIL